jgi:hypothetical protein
LSYLNNITSCHAQTTNHRSNKIHNYIYMSYDCIHHFYIYYDYTLDTLSLSRDLSQNSLHSNSHSSLYMYTHNDIQIKNNSILWYHCNCIPYEDISSYLKMSLCICKVKDHSNHEFYSWGRVSNVFAHINQDIIFHLSLQSTLHLYSLTYTFHKSCIYIAGIEVPLYHNK